MGQTFEGAIKFPTNFDVQTTRPLDVRLVVDSEDNLTDGSITAPYQGMVVNIKGKSELWILKTQGIDESHNINNWGKVTGAGGEVDSEAIKEIRESLGLLSELVGSPDESDLSGLFRELDEIKKNGVSSSFGYSIPIMTPEMAHNATYDPMMDFDESEDAHIITDYDASSFNGSTVNRTVTSIDGTYLDIMMKSIRALQAEVAMLKNSFTYGIDSYKDNKTAKSVLLGEYDNVATSEPLWAIDPGYLSEVEDGTFFNTYLDKNHSFTKYGSGRINVSVDGQLGFENCRGVFSDGDENGNNLTLYNLKDSKLITYLVANKPNIVMTLVSMDDNTKTKMIDFSTLLNGNEINNYGFCVVLSRKVENTVNKTSKGFNYIYFSIINYNTDEKLYEGYLNSNGTLTKTRVDVDERYSIKSISFENLTLTRMKFYTKFEDFSEEVISSAPSEDDYKYEVSHITIRSVETLSILNEIKDQLKDDELVWCKKSGTLHIKSNGKIHLIGSKSSIDYGDSDSDYDNNNDNNMTNVEIITALKNMGIVVNVNYKKNNKGEYTDEIESVENMSLAPISDFSFVNSETGKKFTYVADTEGNLVCKDNSAETIEDFMKELGINAGNYDDTTDYKAVRGFITDYLYRKQVSDNKGSDYTLKSGVNYTDDMKKKSDRLRISSFYAPISTDKTHGCTHSFVELENTSDVDIPLTGIYLHFYNPSEDDYNGTVHHLALDGVIKSGSTYLIRGAKHAEFDDASTFIKVDTFDKEWYEDGKAISFEQKPVPLTDNGNDIDTSVKGVKTAYRFCLTYGIPDLKSNDKLVEIETKNRNIGETSYDIATYPNTILNPRFIDSCSFSTFKKVAEQTGDNNPWYINGTGGTGIVIKANTMFRLTFALDPAKQAFNGFNGKDGSRIRYNKGSDLQILDLNKEFIGYPKSDEIIKIDRYTPKASFENRNVMTDKTQIDKEKPNMVTCSFGNDVYNTRCFNWISCGVFDEYLWVRKKDDTKWNKFQSYTTVSSDTVVSDLDIFISSAGDVTIKYKDSDYTIYYTTDGSTPTDESNVYDTSIKINYGDTIKAIAIKDEVKSSVFSKTFSIYRKEYPAVVNNAAYSRIIDRFPGNDVLFTSHKCVIVLPDASSNPVEYEYVVGRPDKDGNPDPNHINEIYTFTLYPRDYEGRVYQITDQQGFHWIEYQVWAASANYLNDKITSDMSSATNTFPILINTGDMTQSGARINEWLDYYNAGKKLFNHLEQMNVVGNNDLCPTSPNDLGTGNDSDKSNSRFFHYFYCFDVKNTDVYNSENDTNKKFFSGETLVVKKHNCTTTDGTLNISDDKYIPSFYYFKTKGVMYIMVNSEIPEAACKYWYGLSSKNNKYVNIYTGIESIANGKYDNDTYFTPLYETMYAWLNENKNSSSPKKIVVAMHEMPFTVITNESLSNSNETYIPATRNFPLGKKSRVGSNVNQLNLNENRGTYWCSRLLEYFGCKIVIGGHKHTYALSYPIKEKYTWTYNGITHDSGVIKTNGESVKYYDIKPMFSTLEDEAVPNEKNEDGTDKEPLYKISWFIEGNREDYYISDTVGSGVKLNSTKTPYIPDALYTMYGESISIEQKSDRYRCCTPVTPIDNTYNGFITYSMCQATGYKLKSNKELPSVAQVFSKIIPKTTHSATGDTPNANQLYPMYSVLKFKSDYSELEVNMVRITNIFKSNGTDTFNQLSYGSGGLSSMKSEYLCTFERNDCDYTYSNLSALTSALNENGEEYVDKLVFIMNGKFIYKCIKNITSSDGNEKVEYGCVKYDERMYGKWLSESDSISRYNNFVSNSTNYPDNRYLNIKF